MTKQIDIHTAAAALGRKGGQSTSERKAAAARENGKRGGRPKKSQGDDTMSKLLRIQIRDSATSDTFRAVKIFNDGEVEVKRDYGTIGEAARDNFDSGAKIYRGKREITRDYAESGEIG